MNSPLLLHQMVETNHAERTAPRRSGPPVVARTVANLEQVMWRHASLHAPAYDRAVPAWLRRLPVCVDEPMADLAAVAARRGVAEPVCEECA
jgi:hypothetical protein